MENLRLDYLELFTPTSEKIADGLDPWIKESVGPQEGSHLPTTSKVNEHLLQILVKDKSPMPPNLGSFYTEVALCPLTGLGPHPGWLPPSL